MEILTFESLNEAKSFMELCESPAAQSQFGLANHIGALSTNPGTKTFWYWVTNGKRIDFEMIFEAGEPDNANNNEACLVVLNRNGTCTFADIGCTNSDYKFICQGAPKILDGW